MPHYRYAYRYKLPDDGRKDAAGTFQPAPLIFLARSDEEAVEVVEWLREEKLKDPEIKRLENESLEEGEVREKYWKRFIATKRISLPERREKSDA